MTKSDTPDPITPVLTRRWLSPRAWDIDVYEQLEGYTALRYALTGHPDQLIELVKASGLRGRGGAGFPTGMKWGFIPQGPTGAGAKPKYLVVNADEGEPGTCKDIPTMMADPHSLIEGCIITSWAIRAHFCAIYVRGEVVHVLRRLHAAREILQALVVAQHALVEPEAGDLAEALGVLDRAVDRLGPERLRVLHEPGFVAGRLIAVASADGGDPAVALERQHEGSAAGPAGARQAERTLPVFGRVVGNREHGRRVAQIDADRRLSRRCAAHRCERVEGRRAATRGVDHQIGGNRFLCSARAGISDAGHGRAVG